MSTASAVTNVSPTTTKRAPKGVTTTATSNGATAHGTKTVSATINKKASRQGFVLKGGVSYKDAKAQRTAAVREAKSNFKLGREDLKNREKLLASDTKAAIRGEKAVTAAQAAVFKSGPKNPLTKQALVEAKNMLKAQKTALKASTKDVAAQQKLVDKLNKTWAAARDALDNLEAQKKASMN